MTPTADQTLKCCDCPNSFLFTSRDQEFFAQQGYTPPRRCKTCRDQKKTRANEGGRANASQAPQRAPMQPRPAPMVQYRSPSSQEVPRLNSAANQNTPRSFGPDSAPKASLKDEFKGGKKDSERRRDAYEERKKRKNSRSWEDLEED